MLPYEGAVAMNTNQVTRTLRHDRFPSSAHWLSRHTSALIPALCGLSALLIVGCGASSDGDESEPGDSFSKDDARSIGKADGFDYCAEYDWYGDGICDDFCLSPDPDCGQTGCQPVMCELYCENGFKKDLNGCDVCSCAAPQPWSCDAGAMQIEPVANSDQFVATIADQGIIDYLVAESQKTATEQGYTVTKDFPYYVEVTDGPEGKRLVISELRYNEQLGQYSTSDPAATIEPVGEGMKLTMRGMQMPAYGVVVRYEIGNWGFQSCPQY